MQVFRREDIKAKFYVVQFQGNASVCGGITKESDGWVFWKEGKATRLAVSDWILFGSSSILVVSDEEFRRDWCALVPSQGQVLGYLCCWQGQSPYFSEERPVPQTGLSVIPLAEAYCEACDGEGVVGGFESGSDSPGYVTDPCPFCQPK